MSETDFEWMSEETRKLRDQARAAMFNGSPADIPDWILVLLDSAMADMLNGLSERIEAKLRQQGTP